MKKIMMMLVAIAVFASACEDDEKVISESKLPSAAKDFIETHFPDATVVRATKDTEGSTEYDVRLDNGFKLEFNNSGAWREIEGYGAEIPATILDELPEGIVTYVEANHDTQDISKIDRNKSSYEVGLTGGLEVIFNLEGGFVRYDD